jgi:hypothetical protein
MLQILSRDFLMQMKSNAKILLCSQAAIASVRALTALTNKRMETVEVLSTMSFQIEREV